MSNLNPKQLLVNDIYNFMNSLEMTNELLLKPKDYLYNVDGLNEDFSALDTERDLELYKKDYSSRIDKQIYIISLNIMNSLFALNNLKFTAFISRFKVWGFDLTLLQFIINFYLVVKTDNMLRQFVLDHMLKIIKITRSISLKYLITHMNNFNFKETRTDYNKKKIADKIKENKKQIDELMQKRNKKPVEKKKLVKENKEQVKSLSTTTQPQIIPFEAQISSNAPSKIFTLDLMMNMSKEQLQNLNTTIGTQPELETNNLSSTNKETEKEEKPILNTKNLLEQTEDLKKMEQLILNNLKQLHLNLLKGFENV